MVCTCTAASPATQICQWSPSVNDAGSASSSRHRPIHVKNAKIGRTMNRSITSQHHMAAVMIPKAPYIRHFVIIHQFSMRCLFKWGEKKAILLHSNKTLQLTICWFNTKINNIQPPLVRQHSHICQTGQETGCCHCDPVLLQHHLQSHDIIQYQQWLVLYSGGGAFSWGRTNLPSLQDAQIWPVDGKYFTLHLPRLKNWWHTEPASINWLSWLPPSRLWMDSRMERTS